jgi:hypothetical protein
MSLTANYLRRAICAALARSISIWFAVLLSGVQANATSNYSYQKNEYPTVKDGLSPSKKLSVAAHGEGDYGYDNFHLYLMVEPTHEKLARLDGIGPEMVDTGPDAYQAQWSTNSRYVVLYYRADRHYSVMRLYKIENRQVYRIRGPKLLDVVANPIKDKFILNDDRFGSIDLSWVSPTQFILKEWRVFPYGNPKLAAILGKFGISEPFTDNQDPQQYHPIYFSAEAMCELIPGHKYRIHQMKFWDYWRQ